MSLTSRYDFVLFFDVSDGNPNGDPDAGNMPRLDPETMQGLVTDGALKRKIRDFLTLKYSNVAGMEIFVKHGAILNNEIDRAYINANSQGEIKKDKNKSLPTRDQRDEAKLFMCKTFYDIRAFGAVMSTGANAGQVRGPVQLTFARSVDPIVPMEIAITRVAITKPEDAESSQNQGTMGRKHIVPYALYRAHGFISSHIAKQTGFDESDLEKLWEALQNMFEFDHSAARGMMSTRGLYVFKHSSDLGNASAHSLFSKISVKRKQTTTSSPRAFSDYEILIDNNLPLGVELLNLT